MKKLTMKKALDGLHKAEKKLLKAEAEIKGVVRWALESHIDYGEHLLEVQEVWADTPKDEREHATWLELQEKETRLSKRQNYRCMRIAKHKNEVRALAHEGAISSILDAQTKIPKFSEPPRVEESDPRCMAYTGSQPGKKKSAAKHNPANDWSTPPEVMTLVHQTMGNISLDPFSSAKANSVVQADEYFSEADNALDHDWVCSTLFMNPPYGAPLCTQAINKFLEQWDAGNIQEAILLLNSATDTAWFRSLSMKCTKLAFTAGRIQFQAHDGKPVSGNTKGQVFFYFGDNPSNFTDTFSKTCLTYTPDNVVEMPTLKALT